MIALAVIVVATARDLPCIVMQMGTIVGCESNTDGHLTPTLKCDFP